MHIVLPLIALFAFVHMPQAQACSVSSACEVATGEYFGVRPAGVEGPVPAVIHIHGFGGSGNGVFRNTGLVDAFTGRGYAVIAPNGTPRQGGTRLRWAFQSGPNAPRDEVAFLQSVREDAIETFDLDPDKIILSGFSIGGSMAAYTACAAPNSFSAYAPLAGNFWRPHPDACEGPVRMLHTHGWRDGTVPLEGRVLRGKDSQDPEARMQGDIFHAMSIWRDTNECFQLTADEFAPDDNFWRRSWDRCAEGSALELALFPGGHVVPSGWGELVVDWFEGLDSEIQQ